jgi:hypothetical protein
LDENHLATVLRRLLGNLPRSARSSSNRHHARSPSMHSEYAVEGKRPGLNGTAVNLTIRTLLIDYVLSQRGSHGTRNWRKSSY